MYKLLIDNKLVDFIGEPRITLITNEAYNFGRAHRTYTIRVLNRGEVVSKDKHDAILQVGDMQIRGVLVILGDEGDYSEAQFISGAGAIWDDLRGVKMRDLDFSEHDHVLSAANVTASEDGSRFYLYDFVDRGANIDSIALPGAEGTTSWGSITNKPSSFTPSAHTHPAEEISDSTTVGRSLLTLANPSEVRFTRIDADNGVTARSAADFRGDIDTGGLSVANTWSEDNTYSKQAKSSQSSYTDAAQFRNIQVVTELPGSPVAGQIYIIIA
jgi:hypothetical protein